MSTPDGSDGVRILKGPGASVIVIGRDFWTDFPVESCNLNWVDVVPVAVGFPRILPVVESKLSPLGNAGDPGARFHV